jgi:hypothetical protein
MSERVSISIDVLNKVITVLAGLPYQQVSGIIEEVQIDVKAGVIDDSTHEDSGE